MMREPLSCLLMLVAALHGASGSEPVFLMPYPHASADVPMAESPLARLLVAAGRSVISFDAPGTFRSTRKPRVSMDEMLGCALEALSTSGWPAVFESSGHSPFVEEPGRFLEVVGSFLEGSSGRR